MGDFARVSGQSLSFLALLGAPLIYRFVKAAGASAVFARAFLDTSVLCLVLLHVLPHALEHTGLQALAAAGAGLLIGRFWCASAVRRRIPSSSGIAIQAVGPPMRAALLLHMMLDGAVLWHGHIASVWGVALHRLPVALAVWRTCQQGVHSARAQQLADRRAWQVLGLGALCTVLGVWLGQIIRASGTAEHALWFLQALTAGMLTACVLAALTDKDGKRGLDTVKPAVVKQTFVRRWLQWTDKLHPAGLGSACACLVWLVAVWAQQRGQGQQHVQHAVLISLVQLLAQAAPALILGYVLAGLFGLLRLPAPKTRSLSGPVDNTAVCDASKTVKRSNDTAWTVRVRQALGGMLYGLPLPVCSCGVLPIFHRLATRVAPACAFAFLIATPELGLDAVLLSVPLLGTHFAALRALAAALVAVCVGVWVAGRTPAVPHGKWQQTSAPDTAAAAQVAGLPRTRIVQHVRRGIVAAWYGLWQGLEQTGPWIFVGTLLAAYLLPVLDLQALRGMPLLVQIAVAAMVGIPLYVCASGATPLAAALIGKGLCSGAALTFLIVGPATNASTFGVIAKLYGGPIARRFAAGMVLTGVGIGVLLQMVYGNLPLPQLHAAAIGGHHRLHTTGAWQQTALWVLGLLAVCRLALRGPSAFVAALSPSSNLGKLKMQPAAQSASCCAQNAA